MNGNCGSQNNVYIGARYVPKVVGEWSADVAYEPLTVVLYQGTSYTSITYVPKGIIPSEDTKQYWALTGNYNAQVEAYRQEVKQLSTRVDTFENTVNEYTKKFNSLLPYIQRTYNTTTDMLKDTTIIEGMFIKTLGYYTINDGGESIYFITSTQDETKFQLVVNNLYATLVNYGEIYVEQIGAYGNEINDDSAIINKALTLFPKVILNKKYLCSVTIELTIDNQICELNGKLNYNGSNYAVHLSGSNIKLIGQGNITSQGNGVLSIDGTSRKDEICINQMLCLTPNSNIINISNDTGGIAGLYIHDIILQGGSSDVGNNANGIHLLTSKNGYINENEFSTITYRLCKYAIKIENGSSFTLNNNVFSRSEAENSTYQLYSHKVESSNGAIISNYFEFRSNEYANKSDIIDIENNANTYKFNYPIKQKIFTNSLATDPTFYSGSEIRSNTLIGTLCDNSNGAIAVNPTFGMNGNIAVFNFRGMRSNSIIMSSSTSSLSYENNRNLNVPGTELYTFSNDTSASIFQLNNISDWCSCPLQYIEILNPSGTDLSIVSGETTVMANQHLEPGIYKCFYNYQRTSIRMIKM